MSLLSKMKKKMNNIKDKVNYKLLLLTTTPVLSFAGDDFAILHLGKSNKAGDWIKGLVNKPYISIPIKIVILLGIIYAIINIAKELLGSQSQGGSGVWKNVFAILALGLVYYVLFVLITT